MATKDARRIYAAETVVIMRNKKKKIDKNTMEEEFGFYDPTDVNSTYFEDEIESDRKMFGDRLGDDEC